MLVVISPAKRIDFNKIEFPDSVSIPVFIKEAQQLVKILKKRNPFEISSLMGISDKLAIANFERLQQWAYDHHESNSKPAMFTFNGDVYQGLQAATLSKDEILTAQNYVRILSGLYGLLKPLDLIQPYRLEMGTSLKNKKGKNLYEFWGEKITKEINHTLKSHNDKFLINLASAEYFKSIDTHKIKAKIITPAFKEFSNGQLKFISFNAKKVRGMMTRFIIESKISDPNQIKLFNKEGYYFDSEQSTEFNWLFVR